MKYKYKVTINNRWKMWEASSPHTAVMRAVRSYEYWRKREGDKGFPKYLTIYVELIE